MTQLEYDGIAGSVEVRSQIATDAYRYLDTSRIPDIHGCNLRMTIKPVNGLYHAKVSKGAVGKSFAGEFYFPMDAEQSYRRVVKEGLTGIDNLLEPFSSAGGMLVIGDIILVLAQPATASEYWESAFQRKPPEVVSATNGIRTAIDVRLCAYACAKKIADARDGGEYDLENFKEILRIKDKENHFGASITLAAGEDIIKQRYDEWVKMVDASIKGSLLTDGQFQSLWETRQNLDNYEFYSGNGVY